MAALTGKHPTIGAGLLGVRHRGERAVWFFGTSLDSFWVGVPRSLWNLPWHPARMRFRPYPPRNDRKSVLSLELAPRSAYILRGDARWRWQHSIPATKALRYSITFRTLA